MKKFTKEKGITLIALIITIIVMLILVAVTINVALNGGLFTRAKEATLKTEIQQIQEQVLIAKASQMADNEINGTTGYNITIDNLEISQELKNKYRNKLSISSDGELQYNANNCTAEEKAYLSNLGIQLEKKSIENAIYSSTINMEQNNWTLDISFKKKDGLIYACCYCDYNDINLENDYSIALVKDNGNDTYTHYNIIGETTYDFNIEPPTVTYKDEHLNIENRTMELTKENGSLFSSYSPTYNDFTKENNETIRIYNGLYINETKDDFFSLNIILSNNTITVGMGQFNSNFVARNGKTSSHFMAGEIEDAYSELMSYSVLDDGTTLDFSEKTVTATDTNNNVTTYTLVEFD